jgi:hypothetical protein
MTCVLTVLAELQAAVDQLIGTAETVLQVPATEVELQLSNHMIAVARFLQNTKDRYEDKHGETDTSFIVRGARALRQFLVA